MQHPDILSRLISKAMRILAILLFLLPLVSQGQENQAGRHVGFLVQAGHLLYNPRQEPPTYTSSTQADIIFQYVLHPRLALGIGAGMVVLDAGYLFPLYVDLRGDLLPNKRISPHYYAQGGALIAAFPQGSGMVGDTWRVNYEAKGEWSAAYGLGLRIRTNADFDWIFSAGIRTLRITETDYWDWSNQTNRTRLNLQRISLIVGLRF